MRALAAAATRARPSGVRGPVESPPCIRHLAHAGRCRSESHTHGATHGLPARVRAPQRGRSLFDTRAARRCRSAALAFKRAIKASAQVTCSIGWRGCLSMLSTVLPNVHPRKRPQEPAEGDRGSLG